jgi:hypothetical protein
MIAVAYDTPVVGWRAKRVNTLRLWTAQPIDPILLDAFNAGDHIGALRESNKAEALARVLYPADQTPAGQELRLRRSTSSLPPRCRTSCAAICSSTAICAPCRTRWQSSSMTPTRQCPWPS